jgi:TonB family protein
VKITDGQIRISFGYEFTLEERVAELPDAPVAPEGLPNDEDMTSVQKAVAWAKYKDQVTAELEGAIEYPFWAQDLKQEGEVSAEVTIRADGTISKVKIKKRSRHNILNQEVEQAMDRIGSVASFPSWVKDDALTVLIEHNFKL